MAIGNIGLYGSFGLSMFNYYQPHPVYNIMFFLLRNAIRNINKKLSARLITDNRPK